MIFDLAATGLRRGRARRVVLLAVLSRVAGLTLVAGAGAASGPSNGSVHAPVESLQVRVGVGQSGWIGHQDRSASSGAAEVLPGRQQTVTVTTPAGTTTKTVSFTVR